MTQQVHDLPPHCPPGPNGEQCCVGVLRARCRRCGFIGFVNDPCPATADDLREPEIRITGDIQIYCNPRVSFE